MVSSDVPHRPKQVLVVDDEPGIRSVLHQFLTDSGFRVFEAADGAEALELLKHHPVDLITLDLDMPIMDGYAFLTALCERSAGAADGHGTPVPPVFLLTGIVVKESLFSPQARACITRKFIKPMSPLKIVAHISEELGQPHGVYSRQYTVDS